MYKLQSQVLYSQIGKSACTTVRSLMDWLRVEDTEQE